ncbi:SGNH/GDSL hydrolase family protein [Rhodotorula paludigena]|uniref:SGNH/GDSL hydrolase family protein n=1 Tax=Rhodotorula paludigena TaxID=86838 RepID=UPI00317B3BDE
MAVIGGSVSNGHGMLDGRPYVYHAYPDTWHTFVSSWLNETYGPQAYINGAMAATQSSVFRFCWTERVALEEQAPDLVFIELDVNDVLDDESREASEALVRSIMHLPNKPAVLFVGSFALKPQNTKDGQLSGMDAHSPVAAYYDVPQISLRGAFTPALLQDRTLADPYFNGDARHIAPPLHKALGELIITYLEEQRCEVIDPPEDPFVPSDIVPAPTFLGEVPKRLMQERWDTKSSHPHAPPTCRIAGSTLEPATPSPGWASFSFMHAKYYLEAKQADQTVEFDVEIPEGGVGQIGVGYLRSPKYKLGRVICHVGDQEKTLNGQWERSSSLTVCVSLFQLRHDLLVLTLNVVSY